MSAQRQGRAAAQCRAFVREHDLDAYLATLLAPQDDQPRLFAIWTIAADALRLPWSVSEPAMAAIRLQWWREALKAGQGHPALQLLEGQAHVAPLESFLESCARLHGPPLASVGECRQWSQQAFATLMKALGEEPDTPLALGHGLIFLLRRAPWPRRTGQPLLADALDRQAMAHEAQEALKSARHGRGNLPFRLSGIWLKAIRKAQKTGQPPSIPQWRRQLALLKVVITGRGW